MTLLNKPLVRLALIKVFAVFFTTACTSIRYPIQMEQGKIAYASYRYAFYDKQAEVIIKPDGTIEFRKRDSSNADKAIEAAVRAAIQAGIAGVGR